MLGRIGGGAASSAGSAAIDRAAHRRQAADQLRLACDAHALAIALELDLGEAGLVEQARQLADQVVIDRGLLSWTCPCSCARCRVQPLRGAPISAANPSIASA